MTRERTLERRREAIDRRLEGRLESVPGDAFEPARAVVVEGDDRWYGRLVALTYESVAGTPADRSVLDAATAVELFRGSVVLRRRLLTRLDGTGDDATPPDVTAAVLSSDFLYASAYATLRSLPDGRVPTCVGTLASVSRRLTKTFAAALEPDTSPAAYRSFVDGTAGELGRGAASIGATLADVDDRHRIHVERFGRGLASSRRLRRDLAADGDPVPVAPRTRDDRRRRRHARRRFREATRAFRAFSSTVPVDSLRAFVDDRPSAASPE